MCTAFFILGGCGCDRCACRVGGANGGEPGAPASTRPATAAGPALLILFNRDEYFDRETAPAGFWEEHPSVLAGRDLRRGGTWLGVTRGGRWALLTNYREPDPSSAGPGAPSRGALPTDFLTGTAPPLAFLTSIAAELAVHNGFNAVVGDVATGEAAYLTNRGPPGAPGHGTPVSLGPGVYGLSNGPLGRAAHPHDEAGGGDGGDGHAKSGWVKVDEGVAALRALLAAGELDCAGGASPAALPWPSLFGSGLMGSTAQAPPDALPPTGLPTHIETTLSSTFVPAVMGVFGGGDGVAYGTRCQTGVAVGPDGRSAVLVERSGTLDDAAARDAGGCVPVRWTQVVHEFEVEPGAGSGGGAVIVDEAGACAESDGQALVAG